MEPITAREIYEQLQTLQFNTAIAINSAESGLVRQELETVAARLFEAQSAVINASVNEQIEGEF